MLTPGSTLGGRYRLTERIAGGGMGDVWKAKDSVLGREVAVKVLLPALLEDPGFVERFRGEARIMATMNHPGVVDVYDFGESDFAGGGRGAYLVMEYVRGEPLSQVLSAAGRLTSSRAMAFIAQAAEALQAAHDRGITHRDVKPANLLVRPDGSLVLTDFGIARSEGSASLTAAGSTLGTAAYMSPEQAAGKSVGPLSDVYSLGVVAYQCVSGRRPFEGDNPLAVALMHINQPPPPLPEDVPLVVRRFIERAMAKDSAARWPSAAAMAQAARAIAGSGAIPAVPTTSPLPPPPATPAPPPGPARTAVMPPAFRPGGTAPLPGAGVRPGAMPMRGAAAVPQSAAPAPAASVPPFRPRPPAPRSTPQPRKGRGLLVAGITSVLMLLLVLVGIAYAMILAEDRPEQQSTVAVPTTAAPEGTFDYQPLPREVSRIEIDCESMRNKPYAGVESKLRKLGLVPEKSLVESKSVAEGSVVDLPCQAEPGSTVTVQVAQRRTSVWDLYPVPPTPGERESPQPDPSPTTRPDDHQENSR